MNTSRCLSISLSIKYILYRILSEKVGENGVACYLVFYFIFCSFSPVVALSSQLDLCPANMNMFRFTQQNSPIEWSGINRVHKMKHVYKHL